MCRQDCETFLMSEALLCQKRRASGVGVPGYIWVVDWLVYDRDTMPSSIHDSFGPQGVCPERGLYGRKRISDTRIPHN